MTEKTEKMRRWLSYAGTARNFAQRWRICADNRGFSLMELFWVFLVISILAIMCAPSLAYLRDNARAARAAEEIRGLERDITAYLSDHGSLPPTLADASKGPFLDPWGHNYVFESAGHRTFGTALNEDYDLYSVGRNGQTAADIDDSVSNDDIIRIGNGSYVGLVRNLNDF